MNRTVGDKTHESARYGSFLTVERPSRKGFDRLGLILIRQALEGRLPLFTQLPRRGVPGNSGAFQVLENAPGMLQCRLHLDTDMFG
jgi:hypothetical protein